MTTVDDHYQMRTTCMADKKRLNHFLNDLLKLGCVKGLKFFATHLRGREEMVCSIVNEPSIPILLSASNSPASSFAAANRGALPREPDNILISHKRQRRLSGYGFINVGLPPASPADSEDDRDESSTMFLIAGYARYNRPYVWVRSNHERLVRLSSEKSAEKDFPLLLKSTSSWTEKDVKVWDVLADLVFICTSPSPPNPFAVDMDYFESLDLPERVLVSAGMAELLQRILSSGPHSYDRRVQSDLLKISQLHFQSVLELLTVQPPPLTTTDPLQSLHLARPHPSVEKHTDRTPVRQQPLSGQTPASGQPPLSGQPPPSGQPLVSGQQFYSGKRTASYY